MARKINIITNTENYEQWFETQDGLKLDIPYYFLNRIDLKNLKLYSEFETNKFPTLNELTEKKILVHKTGYIEIDKNFKTFNYKRISINKLIEFFKKKGFNVTEEAIQHNLYAYKYDMKSGYRDEKNGYHLFTPCAHNPLSFRLTSLNKNCDWQKTYVR